MHNIRAFAANTLLFCKVVRTNLMRRFIRTIGRIAGSLCLMLFYSLGIGQTPLVQEDFSNFSTLPHNGWTNNIITGNSSFDQWVFNNPGSRIMTTPFSGTFAIFDSDWNSSGGGAENVALESPSFSTLGLNQVRVQFDQYFNGIYSAGDSVIVEVFNGNRWLLVYSYTGVNAIANSQDLNVSTQLNGVSSARIRFRFVGNYSYYWAIDNVKVLGFYNQDVQANQATFTAGVCGSGNDSIAVQIKNLGLQSASGFMVKARVQGTLGGIAINQVMSGTYSGNLSSGAQGSLNLPPIATSGGGTVNITAWTELITDQNVANDSVQMSPVQYLGTPGMPGATAITRCGEGPVQLQATNVQNGDSVVWYSNATAQIPVGSGLQYTTSSLAPGTYTYYVSSGRGDLNGSIALPFNANNEQSGVMFDVETQRTLVVDSFEVSMDSGTFLVEVYYKTGSYVGFETNASAWTLLGTTTVTSMQPNGGSGLFVNVGKKLILPGGSKYAFYIQLPNSTDLNYTNGAGTQSNGELKIMAGVGKGANFGATFSPRSFNGSIRYSYFPQCESNRTAVTAVVNPLPVGSEFLQGTPFFGTFNSGTKNNPHIAGSGDSVRFEIKVPTGFNNSDYGLTWTISNIAISTASGMGVSASDTSFKVPSSNQQASILFIPTVSMVDSSFRFDVTVRSLGGNCDSVISTWVYIAPKPNASFSYQPTCFGQAMTFTNQSSILKGNLNYVWDFGNGKTSTAKNPSFTFGSSGIHQVILTVSSDLGYTDTDTQMVLVKEIPATDFQVLNACEGDPVQLTNTTVMPAGIPIFHWDFGDNSQSSQQNASHIYSLPGSYQVTYTVNVNGCSGSKTKTVTQGPRAKMNFSYTSACNNTQIRFNNHSTLAFGSMGYSWDFGDGGHSTSEDPTYDYNDYGIFNVILRAYTNMGCVDSQVTQVEVIQTPKVKLSYSNPCVGEHIQFYNETIRPTGYTNTYHWSFGDGSQSTDSLPSHQYSGLGTYALKLVAHSTNGCSDSLNTTITINEKPKAGIVAPTLECQGQMVDLKSASVSSNPGALSYFWELGNGKVSHAKDTSLVYANPGNYTLSLVAIMPGGCSDTTQEILRISPQPSAHFIVESAQKGDGSMQFHALENNVSYQWFFGDGWKSNDQSPLHKYSRDETFTVLLVTKNADNCSNTHQQTISIFRTGFDQPNLNATVHLYPNPSNGQFEITAEESIEISEVKIVNALGQEMKMQMDVLGSGNILVRHEGTSAGVYYVMLRTEQGTQSRIPLVIR